VSWTVIVLDQGTTMPNESLTRLFRQWLTQQQINVGEQTHDNEPLDIVEAFPVKGEVTKEFLEQRVWWWRKATLKEKQYQKIFRQEGHRPWSDILFGIYRDRFLLSAYRYELISRCQDAPGYPFDVPWVRCTSEQRRMLECLWPHAGPARHWLPSDEGKVEWVKLSVNFNLKLNDTILADQFQKEIDRLRKNQKITRPGPGHGVARKDPPWLTIELMDRHHLLGEKLNDAGRSQRSKGRQDCQRFCKVAGIALNP
jgi:hypothetical protein